MGAKPFIGTTSTVKKKARSGKKGSNSRSMTTRDLGPRTYHLQKAQNKRGMRQDKYKYKTDTAEIRAGVQRSGVRATAATATTGSAASSVSNAAAAEANSKKNTSVIVQQSSGGIGETEYSEPNTVNPDQSGIDDDGEFMGR